MTPYFLTLLGSFDLRTGAGQIVQGFVSDKTRALLAYLVVEAHTPHRRETLAGLLWGEGPERAARRSLSQALYSLRQVTSPIRDEILVATPRTIHFVPHEQFQADVLTFLKRLQTVNNHSHPHNVLCSDCRHQLVHAVSLYRGEFLSGMSIPDSPAYEAWMLYRREAFQRQVIEALHALADSSRQRAEGAQALEHLWRVLEIDPFREQAHRQIMALLAISGQRTEALKQYERCRQLLSHELGVEPEDATQGLYHRLLSEADVGTARQSDRDENLVWLHRSDSWGLAQTLEVAALVARTRGDYAAAVEHLDEACRIYEESDDPRARAGALTLLGLTMRDWGEYGRAEAFIREARQLYFNLGDRFSQAEANMALARLITFSGSFAEAARLIEDALSIYRELDMEHQGAYGTIGLALQELLTAQDDKARANAQRGMELGYVSRDQLTINFGMSILGMTALGQGQLVKAEQLLKQALVLAQLVGRSEELAAVLASLGYTMLQKGSVARAREYIRDGLQSASLSRNFASALLVLPAAALLLLTRGQAELAHEVYLAGAGFEFFQRSAHLTGLYKPYFGDHHLHAGHSIRRADDVKRLWLAADKVTGTI